MGFNRVKKTSFSREAPWLANEDLLLRSGDLTCALRASRANRYT